MNKILSPQTFSLAVGISLALAGTAQASPFETTDLGGGYLVAGHDASHAEGKCGEGKCGMKAMDSDKDGKVSKAEFVAHKEAKFKKVDTDSDGFLSQAEMDAAKKAHEGKCGAAKSGEGKCGEGKCGAGAAGEGKPATP